MIDIKRLLEEPERMAQNNQNRGKSIDPQVAIALHQKRVVLLEGIQTLRTRGNEIAAKIPNVTSPDERKSLVEEGKGIKDQVKEKEAELAQVEAELATQLKRYPNILREDVPAGKDETSNELVRTFGEPTKFDFEPKDHLDLGVALDVIDMDRAAKVSG
ncbi:MAG: serine--tRNA ligase, partial [Candidatus Uhrbacteria bacterium]|nr:serine--tRNA ligase [Candidatus Uhrbacteria bacterium]